MEAAHPGAGKAAVIVVLLFTWPFPDALKIQNYTSTISSQPAKQDRLPTVSRSNPQQFNFTASTILEGKQDFPTLLAAATVSPTGTGKPRQSWEPLGEKQSYTR